MTEKQYEYRRFVGRQVAKKRKSLGISQGKLGELLGVKTSTVSSWELGTNPLDADKIFLLSAALGESPSYFLDDVGQLAKKKFSFLPELMEAFGNLDLDQQALAVRLLQAIPAFDYSDEISCSLLLAFMKRQPVFDVGAFLEECLSAAEEREAAISKKVSALALLRAIREASDKYKPFPTDIEAEIEEHIQAISDCLSHCGYTVAVDENMADKEMWTIEARENAAFEREVDELKERFEDSWYAGYGDKREYEVSVDRADWDD